MHHLTPNPRKRKAASPHTHTHPHPHPHANPHTHPVVAHPHPHPHAHSHARAYSHSHSQPHPDSDTDARPAPPAPSPPLHATPSAPLTAPSAASASLPQGLGLGLTPPPPPPPPSALSHSAPVPAPAHAQAAPAPAPPGPTPAKRPRIEIDTRALGLGLGSSSSSTSASASGSTSTSPPTHAGLNGGSATTTGARARTTGGAGGGKRYPRPARRTAVRAASARRELGRVGLGGMGGMMEVDGVETDSRPLNMNVNVNDRAQGQFRHTSPRSQTQSTNHLQNANVNTNTTNTNTNAHAHTHTTAVPAPPRPSRIPDSVLQRVLASAHIPPAQPPITRHTLRELDLGVILQNPVIRHDLLFDPNLQLRPRRARAAAEHYWAAVAREAASGCTCVTVDARGRRRETVCVCAVEVGDGLEGGAGGVEEGPGVEKEGTGEGGEGAVGGRVEKGAEGKGEAEAEGDAGMEEGESARQEERYVPPILPSPPCRCQRTATAVVCVSPAPAPSTTTASSPATSATSPISPIVAAPMSSSHSTSTTTAAAASTSSQPPTTSIEHDDDTDALYTVRSPARLPALLAELRAVLLLVVQPLRRPEGEGEGVEKEKDTSNGNSNSTTSPTTTPAPSSSATTSSSTTSSSTTQPTQPNTTTSSSTQPTLSALAALVDPVALYTAVRAGWPARARHRRHPAHAPPHDAQSPGVPGVTGVPVPGGMCACACAPCPFECGVVYPYSWAGYARGSNHPSAHRQAHHPSAHAHAHPSAPAPTPRAAQLFAQLGATLREHCAPMRDARVDAMVRAAAHPGPRAFAAVRMCVELLEVMKLDIANHQLAQLRPWLLRHAAAFEARALRLRFGAPPPLPSPSPSFGDPADETMRMGINTRKTAATVSMGVTAVGKDSGATKDMDATAAKGMDATKATTTAQGMDATGAARKAPPLSVCTHPYYASAQAPLYLPQTRAWLARADETMRGRAADGVERKRNGEGRAGGDGVEDDDDVGEDDDDDEGQPGRTQRERTPRSTTYTSLTRNQRVYLCVVRGIVDLVFEASEGGAAFDSCAAGGMGGIGGMSAPGSPTYGASLPSSPTSSSHHPASSPSPSPSSTSSYTGTGAGVEANFPETLYLDRTRLARLGADAADARSIALFALLFRMLALCHRPARGAQAQAQRQIQGSAQPHAHDAVLAQLKRELRDICPAGTGPGACLVPPEEEEGEDLSASITTTRAERVEHRRLRADLALQVARRASELQHAMAADDTSMDTSPDTPAPAPEANPALLALAQTWARTHMHPRAPLAALVQTRLREAVFTEVIARLARVFGPVPLTDDAAIDAGAAAASSPYAQPVRGAAPQDLARLGGMQAGRGPVGSFTTPPPPPSACAPSSSSASSSYSSSFPAPASPAASASAGAAFAFVSAPAPLSASAGASAVGVLSGTGTGAGALPGLAGAEDEVRRLAERVARLAAVHLHTHLPMYEAEAEALLA